MKLLKSDEKSVLACVESLKKGNVIIIPTDTVYGFSAILNEEFLKQNHFCKKNSNIEKNQNLKNNFSNSKNIQTEIINSDLPDSKIRKIKGREETKPFILLIGNPSDIKKYTDDEIPESLLNLWPGPLTIIVHDKNSTSTTAFRCPDEKWLCDILQKLDSPIYSTSANRSGKPLLEKISDIEKEFSGEVDLIIDDGDKIGGVASTIVSIENGKVKVIRQGAVIVDC